MKDRTRLKVVELAVISFFTGGLLVALLSLSNHWAWRLAVLPCWFILTGLMLQTQGISQSIHRLFVGKSVGSKFVLKEYAWVLGCFIAFNAGYLTFLITLDLGRTFASRFATSMIITCLLLTLMFRKRQRS